MEVLADAKEEECASTSMSTQSAPLQRLAGADAEATTTSNEECNSATTNNNNNNSDDGSVVGDVSKPLFPAFFYKMRLEGKELVSMNKPNKETVAAWRKAGQLALSSAQTNLQTLAHSFIPGENAAATTTTTVLCTPFGTGTLLEYRESTETYVVQLSFGGILYTQKVPEPSSETPQQRQKQLFVLPFMQRKKRKTRTAVELNQEFVQWEETRRQEMIQECQRWGIPYTDKTQHQCFACLMAKAQQREQSTTTTTNTKTNTAFFSNEQGQPRFPRLFKLRQSGQELVTQNKHHVMPDINRCLLCVTPTCAQHSSPAFRKENVALCLDCVQHLECRDSIMMQDNSTTTLTLSISNVIAELEEKTRHLQDLYGRALLLLQYCQPFMETTAQQLDQQTKQHNEIAGVGGSSVGIVSGIMGVAAACTSESFTFCYPYYY
jgi:hypothetical protein